jgi:hypothetical protein
MPPRVYLLDPKQNRTRSGDPDKAEIPPPIKGWKNAVNPIEAVYELRPNVIVEIGCDASGAMDRNVVGLHVLRVTVLNSLKNRLVIRP